MILSDYSLYKLVKDTDVVSPVCMDNIQPASIDLRLDDKVIYPDIDNSTVYCFGDDFGGELLLKPNDFVLCNTVETVHIPLDMVGRVDGKSSVARTGCLVHITAGFIDSGFEGSVTLEIKNLSNTPIVLKKDCCICQLSLEQLDRKVVYEYGEKNGNHYSHQRIVTPSRYERNEHGHYVIE